MKEKQRRELTDLVFITLMGVFNVIASFLSYMDGGSGFAFLAIGLVSFAFLARAFLGPLPGMLFLPFGRSKSYLPSWKLVSRILPLQARKESFEPSFEDLKREHLLDLRQFKGKWERRWLMFCFHANAARLIAESLRVWFWAKTLLALKLVWEFVIGG